MRKAKPKKSKALSNPSSPASISRKEEARWRAEDDMRTIRRAEEIKADSKRLSAARKIAAEEVKALKKISGK